MRKAVPEEPAPEARAELNSEKGCLSYVTAGGWWRASSRSGAARRNETRIIQSTNRLLQRALNEGGAFSTPAQVRRPREVGLTVGGLGFGPAEALAAAALHVAAVVILATDLRRAVIIIIE